MLNNSGHDKLGSKRQRNFVAGSLFMFSFGILLLIAFSPAIVYAETITVDAEGDSFEVEYSTTGLTLSSIETDLEIPSVILTVDVTSSSSTLDIVLERSFLDSKFDGVDDDFIILADGDFANFVETEITSQSRTLSIDVPSGTEEIEIIGSIFGDSSSVLVVDIPEPVEETPEPVEETPEPVEETPEPVEETPESTTTDPTDLGIASFVDETKDPQSYVDRYNTEASYKQWFDDNFPEYSSIYQAVGLEEPPVDIPESVVETPEPVIETPKTQCGPGTTLQDGACVLDERCGPGTVLQGEVCVLVEPVISSSNTSDISVKGLGKELVIGLIAAFVVAGIIGIVLALMSKASKSSD